MGETLRDVRVSSRILSRASRPDTALLLGLTALMALSGATIALAPNYAIQMLGRALIGVVIGGFWSMSAATVMRLVSNRTRGSPSASRGPHLRRQETSLIVRQHHQQAARPRRP